MELNITFFIQGGNFFIAYIMVRRMLLTQAVTMIRHAGAYQAALEQVVKDRKVLVVQKEHERIASWEAIQQELMELHPSQPERTMFLSASPSSLFDQVPVVTDEAVETVAHDITTVLCALGDRKL